MKHILITGGSDGIGKLAATKLQAAENDVTILGRDPIKTQSAAAEIGCKYAVVDVTDASEVQRVCSEIGQVDVLINNAGIWVEGPIDEMSLDGIHKTIDINTLGTIYTTQAVVAGMKQRSNGRIINIISQAGLYGRQNRSVYSASKWALTGFTQSLQEELKPFGIAVSGFYPGAINTGFFAKAGSNKDRSKALDPGFVADALVYLCNLPDHISVPEFGLTSLEY